MSSEPDDPTDPNTYVLTCNDCSFEETVEGTDLDALDLADSHQEGHGPTLTAHFVNFELTE